MDSPVKLTNKDIKEKFNDLKYWKIIENHHLESSFEFENQNEAKNFVERINKLSEEIQHHPDIKQDFVKVNLIIYTHSINGLSNLDHKFAKRVEDLFE